MAILDRLKNLLRPTQSPVPASGRRPSSAQAPEDAGLEDELRATLHADPNDVEAFRELADLVRRRAEEAPHPDPLIAESGPIDMRSRASASQWALAEELAGNPRAWYPLIELARLSLDDDHEGAMRRLGAACERDLTGLALVEGIKMLREARLPAEALALGVGHWSPAEQISEAGRQVVHAALDAGRAHDARTHLKNLATYGAERPGNADVVAELEPFVAAAEAEATGA